jgi:flagellar M-ring protein FliF
MNPLAHIEQLWRNLTALGPKRLAALGLIGLAVFAIVGLSGYYLSRPSTVPLYSNLDRDDVVSIGSALREAGIPFDVNADANTVMVPVGKAALARMTLAEKGLPHSGSDGYELFDKLGSLGLTSFMQEVTKVRALEGELARTIQMMQGVRAARVQIVMGDEGSFRREKQKPSASVVIRTDGSDDRMMAQAIRHLVASSLPGMTPDEVTVLDVNGLLLASGSDSIDQEPSNMLSLEKKVSQDVQESVRRTLAPYLTLHNFQVSVAARLDTDKIQTSETTFDPDSRVERSVRVVRENQNTQNSSAQPPTTVTQNLPQQPSQSSDSKQSTDDSQKRDELTNYEISSKTVTTTSSGYSVKRLSVAVLVNRGAFVGSDGHPLAADAVQHQVADIEQLVSSAAGLQKDRGDVVKISVVDFADSAHELQPAPGPTLMDIVEEQSGTLIEAIAVILVASMLLWFGLRPATRALLATGQMKQAGAEFEAHALPGSGMQNALADHASGKLMLEPTSPTNSVIDELLSRKEKSPQRFLEQLVDYDEVQAAAVLKQWMRKGADA